MEKTLESFKFSVAVLGTLLTWLLGTWDMALKILITFMIVDYVTGLIKGWYTKELSSDVGLKGIARKFLIVLVLIVAVLLDRLLSQGTWVFRTLACYFYIANEGMSILENTSELGVPWPKSIKDALAQLRDKENKE